MYCPNCGHLNLPGADVCSACGTDLSDLDPSVGWELIAPRLQHDIVAQLPPREPLFLSATSTLAQAVQAMATAEVGAAFVVDESGHFLGIFTERDLLLKWNSQNSADMVQQHMTANPETIAPDAPIIFALAKMDSGGYRHLPVVKDGRPIGVISVRDMLKYLTALFVTV